MSPADARPVSAAVRPPIKIGWTVYAALLTVFVLAGEVRNAMVGAGIDLVAVANWVLTAVLLTATWGHALQRRFGVVGYWRAAFWIVLFATVVMLIPVALSPIEVIYYTAALMVLVLPVYVAAYLYAYRSPALWADTPAR